MKKNLTVFDLPNESPERVFRLISSDKNINKYNKLKENLDLYKYFKTYYTKITKAQNTTNKVNIKN